MFKDYASGRRIVLRIEDLDKFAHQTANQLLLYNLFETRRELFIDLYSRCNNTSRHNGANGEAD
jgi:hypothetical protein